MIFCSAVVLKVKTIPLKIDVKLDGFNALLGGWTNPTSYTLEYFPFPALQSKTYYITTTSILLYVAQHSHMSDIVQYSIAPVGIIRPNLL